MQRHRIVMIACILSGPVLESCEMYLYANATAPLVAPVDSVCLKDALTKRLGSPSGGPQVEKSSGRRPAALWLYYERASFTQTYPDTGGSTLSAAQVVGAGVFATRRRFHRAQDSVSHKLGSTILAVREDCGGQSVPGLPEITYPR